jgi:hypothetical protein
MGGNWFLVRDTENRFSPSLTLNLIVSNSFAAFPRNTSDSNLSSALSRVRMLSFGAVYGFNIRGLGERCSWLKGSIVPLMYPKIRPKTSVRKEKRTSLRTPDRSHQRSDGST